MAAETISLNDALYWVDKDGTAHERCKLAWHYAGEWLGETPFDPGEHPELRWPRNGWAFYCPYCVDIWARIIMFRSDDKMQPCEVVTAACAKHPDSWNIPGSLLVGKLEGLLPLLPAAVAEREFQITLAWWDRENGIDTRNSNNNSAGSSGDGEQTQRSESPARRADRHG